MKKKHIFIITLCSLSLLVAARPTFVNMQTVDGMIHYPTITAVSETEITLATGTVVNIADVNSVMAYGESKSMKPLLWGAGCFYLGQIPGIVIGIMIAPDVFANGGKSAENKFFVSVYATAALSGYYAYRRASVRASERSQTMVFMGGWSLEQKRDFFYQILSNL